MKGVIFNLLEDVVSRQYGDSGWDTVLAEARLDGSYTSLGNYPDSELEILVDAAAKVLGMPAPRVLRWYGRAAMPILHERYPEFFQARAGTIEFVLSLNAIIHPEVMALYPGARCPVFRMRMEPDGSLLLGYDSPRRLCMLAHGFIEGASDHYRQSVDVCHLTCMHDGDTECRMRVAAG